MHDRVELVAMDDQEALAVGGLMDRAVGDDDAAEMHALEHAQELVVVAGDVGDAGALARLAQQLLDDVVVASAASARSACSRQPSTMSPTRIDRLGLVMAQEIDQEIGLRRLRSEMDVGDEQGAELLRRWRRASVF